MNLRHFNKVLRTLTLSAVALFSLAPHTAHADATDGAARSEREPVLMIGDSMMKLLAIAFEKEFRARNITATSFASLGSGLVRLDAFDWFGKVNTLMDEHQPGTAIVMLGANDNQPLMDDNGVTVAPGTPEWDTAYGERLGKMIDLLLAKKAQRVIWILLPDMQQAVQQRYALRFNSLLETAVADRKGVVLFDSRPPLRRRTSQNYAATIISPEGRVVQVRSADGIHLSKEGAERLAAAVVKELWP